MYVLWRGDFIVNLVWDELYFFGVGSYIEFVLFF